MFDTILFLGLPLSNSYQLALLQLPSAEQEIFIQNQGAFQDSPYLQKIEHEGIEYLGKYLGSSIDMATLDLSYSHIVSLLKKLIPQFPYEQNPLFLLALPSQNSSF